MWASKHVYTSFVDQLHRCVQQNNETHFACRQNTSGKSQLKDSSFCQLWIHHSLFIHTKPFVSLFDLHRMNSSLHLFQNASFSGVNKIMHVCIVVWLEKHIILCICYHFKLRLHIDFNLKEPSWNLRPQSNMSSLRNQHHLQNLMKAVQSVALLHLPLHAQHELHACSCCFDCILVKNTYLLRQTIFSPSPIG